MIIGCIFIKKVKMKNLGKTIKCLASNIQIQSALLWAITILGCTIFSSKTAISTILVTAAGFHVIMLYQFVTQGKLKKEL